MKVVAFRHLYSEGLGTLAQVIEKAGGTYSYMDTYREDCSCLDPLGPDLVIVLGGTPGVYQADDYPFLKDEMKIIEARLKQDRPTLGICLGAQMMAHVLGSKVYVGAQGIEIGWHPLTLTEAGRQTSLRYLDRDQTSMLHWHGDTFDLPQGATLLASSDLYVNQAFQYGNNALGLQCHSEITPNMLKGWSVAAASLVAEGRFDVHALRGETETYGPRLIAQTEKFMMTWLRDVGLRADREAEFHA